MSDNRNLQKLVRKIINVMPDEISDDQLVCIILSFLPVFLDVNRILNFLSQILSVDKPISTLLISSLAFLEKSALE